MLPSMLALDVLYLSHIPWPPFGGNGFVINEKKHVQCTRFVHMKFQFRDPLPES